MLWCEEHDWKSYLVVPYDTVYSASQIGVIRYLGGHTQELAQAGEGFYTIVAAVPIYTTTELAYGQKVHQLRKCQSY